jgi:hypothetical protein
MDRDPAGQGDHQGNLPAGRRNQERKDYSCKLYSLKKNRSPSHQERAQKKKKNSLGSWNRGDRSAALKLETKTGKKNA